MSADSAAGRTRILIADDCATSRQMAEFVLRPTGHEILTATNGEEAVGMAASMRPDLIVLDLQMPKLGGLAALRELKRSPDTRDVPVIVVTISGEAAAYRAAAESGCDAFLTKPFAAETLLLSVEENLKRRRPRLAPPAARGAERGEARGNQSLAMKPDTGDGQAG
jgi:two-component system phosphate regulon response regulator PhoB